MIPRKWAVKCIPYPKTQKRVLVILSRGEVIRLFQHASSEKEKMFMMLAYATGLRMMELCHLRVSDIDGDRKVLIVRKLSRLTTLIESMSTMASEEKYFFMF